MVVHTPITGLQEITLILSKTCCQIQGLKMYNYHNSGHYPSSCLLFKTHLNSIGLSVPHNKHITSPLRAKQVNAIYRFVAMVY
jgi:hypothetical protein